MRKALHIILALLLPPVGVYIKGGLSLQLALNVFLCFAFFLPAVVHAVWFVARGPSAPADREPDDKPADDGQPPQRREPVFS